jgi:energy-coupling factor transport system ATP-binding protein
MESSAPIIEVKDVCYRPLTATEDVICGVTLDIFPGDFILLLGPSGSGKTLLTRCMNGLIPSLDQGEMSGEVFVRGKNTQTHEIHEFATEIGMVFQNPDDQILSLKVVDEVAWGVENQGLPHKEIKKRVDEFIKLLEIEHLKNRLTFAISGGQKQKVSIASNLAMLQELLILDDPTTDLDPICTTEVIQTLAHLHKELDKTLIVIEHDLNELIELANRIVFMDHGSVLFDGTPTEVLTQNYDLLMEKGFNMPQHVEIAHGVCEPGEDLPVGKEEAFEVLRGFVQAHPDIPTPGDIPQQELGDTVLKVEDLHFAYEKNVPILKDLNFEIRQGEFVAIIGANGSGKSTLVKNLINLLTPHQGSIMMNGHDTRDFKLSELVSDIGYVFQNPDQQLFNNNVFDEVAFSLRLKNEDEDEIAERVQEVLEVVGLEQYVDQHPYSLSRGQRQKLAVATALLHRPKITLLDEPTTGQDRRSLSGLLNLMVDLDKAGHTTIIVTHDMDIVAAYASRVIVMEDGQIVMDGTPQDVFYDGFDRLNSLNLRPPTVIDFCRRLEEYKIPRMMTVDQVLTFVEEVKSNNK